MSPCDCYWLTPQQEHRLSLTFLGSRYDDFRRGRAHLRKAYDDAVDEEKRLAYMCLKAREWRHELKRTFERSYLLASTIIMLCVIGVTELRDVIFLPLLPGDVLAFQTAYGRLLDKHQIAADLSPLMLVLSESKRLPAMCRD